jgi:hypothetical protein
MSRAPFTGLRNGDADAASDDGQRREPADEKAATAGLGCGSHGISGRILASHIFISCLAARERREPRDIAA